MKISSENQLREIYGYARGRAKDKELNKLERHSTNFIRKSPFIVLSTSNSVGVLDSSPRGGKPGFVTIINASTIIIPDSKGNNRLDSLTNIIANPNVGTLFLIPGIDETLRINGKAELVTDEPLLQLYSEERTPPKCLIRISISEVFLHCAKALMRSELWSQTSKIDRKELPTMGQMINDQLGDTSEPETQDEMIKRYQVDL
jgi:PPOX class probable FMN-dependent enzyme